MTFAEQLKVFRERTGLTQKQAAGKFGVKQATWQMWEDGKRVPKIYSQKGLLLMMAEYWKKHH